MYLMWLPLLKTFKDLVRKV
ncbi:UNVERIFIED_CONTAM: hypothetical protein GTU68_026983 [Idotea baltica]|nr:hypothetical protein [Idotea baltica]